VIDHLAFPGGTLEDYAQAIRGNLPLVNIVVMPEARSLPVPPVELHTVGVDQALDLLEGESYPDERTIVRITVRQIGVAPGAGEPTNPVFRISAEKHSRGRPAATEVQVWTVAALLSKELPAEAILTAIETSVDLASGTYGPAEVRFHEATGLIIACGYTEQLDAIDCVIDRLQESAAQRQGAADTKAGDEVRAKIAELSTLATARANEIEQLKLAHAQLAEKLASSELRVRVLENLSGQGKPK
jgi:hypothetical protein